jgi:hypothetical protein
MTTDRMKIRPENLAAAATDSTATQAARAPVTIASPPPAAAGSPVDAAAVAVGTTIQAALAAADTADVAAVTKQTAALTDSRPGERRQHHRGQSIPHANRRARLSHRQGLDGLTQHD